MSSNFGKSWTVKDRKISSFRFFENLINSPLFFFSFCKIWNIFGQDLLLVNIVWNRWNDRIHLKNCKNFGFPSSFVPFRNRSTTSQNKNRKKGAGKTAVAKKERIWKRGKTLFQSCPISWIWKKGEPRNDESETGHLLSLNFCSLS